MARSLVDARHSALSLADHRLSVPRPLEELYKIYLRELAGNPGDAGTLKVGRGRPSPLLHPRQGTHPLSPTQGTSLPKILQVSSAESLPDSDQDSAWVQNCEHPMPLQQGPRHDTLPPLRPTGDRYGWASTTPRVYGAAAVAEGKGCPLSSSTPTPAFKKTPQAQQLGSTAVPTATPSRDTVAQEVSMAMPAAQKPRGGDGYGCRVSWQCTPRASLASLSTRHDSSLGSGTSSEAAVAAGRGEPSGRRG